MEDNFSRLRQELKIRRCSQRTARSYLYYNQDFLNFCRKMPEMVTRQDVRNYLESLADKRCSGATMRLAFSSLRFYYTEILKKNVLEGLKYPKPDRKITVGLTKEEVSRLISVVKNPKHRLLIELIYASGVRAQEAVRIRIKDILTEEKLAVVRSGKGNKDRKTILSEKFLKDFNKELETENYLFPGRQGHLTVRSVQQIVKDAANKAGIRKKVYPHLLRHAFATHLHQNKIDVRYIQKLLGHKDQKTTEGYVNVSGEELRRIKSPHDDFS